MNILQVAVLFAITLKCVTASTVKSSELEEGEKATITSDLELSLLHPLWEATWSLSLQPQASSSGQLVPRARKSDLNPYEELIGK